MAAISFAALSLAACTDASNQLPPFADIETATLAYVNCINNKARSEALRLKAVPVMAKTISEFDDIHNGLAKYVVAEPRKKDPNAPNQ